MNDLTQPIKPAPMPKYEREGELLRQPTPSKFEDWAKPVSLARQNDQPAEVPAAEAERYLQDGSRVLELARRRVHELEALISGQQAEMARLRDIIARLEVLRDG
jgi:hypothetical protein